MVVYDSKILEEKELEILRKAVDIAEKKASKKTILSPEIKNIIEIVNNVLQVIQNNPYYSKSINLDDIDLKDIDMLWDYFRLTSNIYKKKNPNHKLDIELDKETKFKLNNIIENNIIFKTIFSLHILTDKPHIITF